MLLASKNAFFQQVLYVTTNFDYSYHVTMLRFKIYTCSI